MISIHPAYSVGLVDQDWIDRVETHQKKKLVSLGDFSLEYLAEMVDMLSSETSGEIELLVSAENIMPDKTRAGLFVAKYDGKNYVALAGISHGSGVDTAPEGGEHICHNFGCLGEHERRITELEVGDLTLRVKAMEKTFCECPGTMEQRISELETALKALREKKAENHTETVCPECGSGQLVHDYERAELVCQSCGLVIDDE